MDDENNPYLIITSDEDVFRQGKKAMRCITGAWTFR